MDNASDKGLVRVWDPLIRIGHWVLVAGFATAYLTEGEPQWLHTFAGYAIAATVALRILWGIVGPRRARFTDFVTGPGRVFSYLHTRHHALRRDPRPLSLRPPPTPAGTLDHLEPGNPKTP